ncbi:MAG: GTPase ObgE [Candidatus Limnocylindria bacterium]
MFADRTRIFVQAGAGGDGSSSFRREAHVPRGGPDGGDGGDGGDVILLVEAGMTTLGDHRRRRHVRATAGGRGSRRRSHGRNGADAIVRVPPGTVARTHPDGTWIGELMAPGERLVVARGGRGGRGNVHFATATHRAPQHAEKGTPGEEAWIELELKLIADIGLVGAPNAGKSTLLAALTAARPDVGEYPFTTISPNLGVVELGDERVAVMADVPGLIEGAHEGRGLGHQFLRHVERTRALVGVIDGAAADPVAQWRAVADELRLHDPRLADRPIRLVVTKLDLAEVRDRWPSTRDGLAATGEHAIAVSAHDGAGLDELRTALGEALDEADQRVEERAPDEVRVHRFDPLAEGWEVVTDGGQLRVRGRRIETAAARTDFENSESRDRFQHLLERLGIDAELRRRGAAAGAIVHIGRAQLEWGDEE